MRLTFGLQRDTERRDWLALVMTALIVALLLALSVLRYEGYNAGMLDIGNMSQAIWSVTQGQPLEYTREDGNISRLAWHVEIIYLAIAPLYALWPDPRLLLVLQAVLFGLGALPVYRLASRRSQDRTVARIFTLIYLFYPTANTAVLFDFHGDTLALPLLMFALDAMDRRAWRRYGLWLGLALLCKFYVSVAVAALGIVLWIEGQKRAGIFTTAVGVGWLCVTVFLIRPTFAPPGASGMLAGSLRDYAEFYFGGIREMLFLWSIPQRLATVFIVLMPALVFGRFAWLWMLPGLAIALPAFFSIGEVAAFDYRFHHYAIPVPFFVLATIYGVDEVRRLQEGRTTGRRCPRRPWRNDLWFNLALSVLFFVLLVDTPLNPRFWLNIPNWGLHHTKYGQLARDRLKDRWLAENVPPDVPIAATGLMASHMVDRTILYQTRYSGPVDEQRALFLQHLAEVEYVVVDALFDFAVEVREGVVAGGVSAEWPPITDLFSRPEFGLVRAQDGLLLFAREADASDRLMQRVSVEDGCASGEVIASFGDRVGLVATEITPLGDRRYRLSFSWVALRSLGKSSPLFAVTRLSGVAHHRYPHLPTIALYPSSDWEPGQIVHEVFDIQLPPALPRGDYSLVTGWYDACHLDAAMTDSASRLGQEQVTLTLTY